MTCEDQCVRYEQTRYRCQVMRFQWQRKNDDRNALGLSDDQMKQVSTVWDELSFDGDVSFCPGFNRRG